MSPRASSSSFHSRDKRRGSGYHGRHDNFALGRARSAGVSVSVRLFLFMIRTINNNCSLGIASELFFNRRPLSSFRIRASTVKRAGRVFSAWYFSVARRISWYLTSRTIIRFRSSVRMGEKNRECRSIDIRISIFFFSGNSAVLTYNYNC